MTYPPTPEAHRTLIKICGIRTPEMAQIAVTAGADAIGLVIGVPRSPRNLTLSQAVTIAGPLPRRVMVVAVFQDPSATLVEGWKGAWVQLHGNEDEELIGRVGRTKHVIKGLQFDTEQVLRFNDCRDVDILLIDGSSGGRAGGFDHQTLADLMPQISKPIIVAGGLTPQNVTDAIRIVHPLGVDVSSGVESSPGVKDAGLVNRFCQAVAEAEK